MRKKISMSIQAANLLDLKNEISKYIEAGIDSIHLDIMDHQYANNFAFGGDWYKKIREEFQHKIQIDVHFMITNPQSEIKKFIALKPNLIIIDALSMNLNDLKKYIFLTKSSNIPIGIAIQLEDDLNKYQSLYPFLDAIMLMSVPIGKSGQKFNQKVYQTLEELRSICDTRNKIIAIDGGVRLNNFQKIIDAGFNFIVIGSILKGENNYANIVKKLKNTYRN